MKSVIWFDRKFTFDIANEMFPMVVERLRGTPTRIKDRVSVLPQEILIKRISDDWSIQENVGHLWDLEPLWYGRIEDFRAGRERLRPAELTNKKTHEAQHNETSIEYILSEFTSARTRLVTALDGMDNKHLALTAQHPRLDQPMRLIDCAFFIAEHDDHHMAEISRLLKSM